MGADQQQCELMQDQVAGAGYEVGLGQGSGEAGWGRICWVMTVCIVVLFCISCLVQSAMDFVFVQVVLVWTELFDVFLGCLAPMSVRPKAICTSVVRL